jgi:hypothetical protein
MKKFTMVHNIHLGTDKYFVKIRDYKYDTFTKSWDIIYTTTYILLVILH